MCAMHWTQGILLAFLVAIGSGGCAKQSSLAATPQQVVFGHSWIADHAGIFTPKRERELSDLVHTIERETTVEVGVATVKTLGPMSIHKFATMVFNHHGIGKRIKDNGVLILVVTHDRKVRIAVGNGLEPVITDQRAGEILDAHVTSHFKKGDFFQGLSEALNEIRSEVTRPDVQHYFTMSWQTKSFEGFLRQYPESVLRCDALMFSGRLNEDVWAAAAIRAREDEARRRAIACYERYLRECPHGIRRAIVEHEWRLAKAGRPNGKRHTLP